MNNSTTSQYQSSIFDPIKIPLGNNIYTFVDLVDSDLGFNKWNNSSGYARRISYNHGNAVRIYMHRVILERILKRTLIDGEQVDHINGNRLDNRRSNLRIASRTQNLRNRKMRKDNQSGYKGVQENKPGWMAKIVVDRKVIYLGQFHTPEEAHAAYCEASKKYHKEFGHE